MSNNLLCWRVSLLIEPVPLFRSTRVARVRGVHSLTHRGDCFPLHRIELLCVGGTDESMGCFWRVRHSFQ